MSGVSLLSRCALLAAAHAAAIVCARAEEEPAREAPRLQCYSTAQARDQIETRKLIETRRLLDPFACMRAAAARLQSEPLRTRLCYLGEALLYEISLLRPDGRIVKILVDAVSGRPYPGRTEK